MRWSFVYTGEKGDSGPEYVNVESLDEEEEEEEEEEEREGEDAEGEGGQEERRVCHPQQYSV